MWNCQLAVPWKNYSAEVNNTNCIPVFHDELLTYKAVDVFVTIQHIDMQICLGTFDLTFSQVHFRFCENVFELISLISLLKKSKKSFGMIYF